MKQLIALRHRLQAPILLLASTLLTFAAAQSQQSNTLVYVMAQQPVQLDPANIVDSGSAHIAIHVTEPLIITDSQGALRPHLAESWESNEDASIWTIHLRHGVSFTDGTPFNAQAVKYTYDRIVDPENPKATAANFPQIKEAVVLDDYTVQFHLHGPYLDLPRLLTQTAMFIVSPTAAEALGGEFANHPVGTGPFILESFVSGESARLVRNPDYWQEMGNLDAVSFIRIAETSTRTFMLETGEADVVQELSPDDIAYIDSLPNARVDLSTGVRQYMVSMNTQIAPLNDVRVRQALNYAIDKEAIVEHLMLGTATANDSILPPTADGYVPVGAYPYDPEKARQLLAEAGYADGFSLNYWGPTPGRSRANAEVAQQIQDSLAALGITMTITTADGAANIERLRVTPERAAEIGKNLMYLGAPPSGGTQLFFETFFVTDAWAPNRSNNGYYSNPLVDDLVKRAGTTTDLVERQQIYGDLQKIIMDDAPWIFLYTIAQIWGVNDRVSGLEYLPNDLVLFTHASVGR